MRANRQTKTRGAKLSAKVAIVVGALAGAGATLVLPARADITTQEADERAALAREIPAAAAALNAAETAFANGRFVQAAQGFARSAELATRSPLPLRRQCEALTAAGKKTEAIAACERAKTIGAGPLEMRATVTAYLAGGGPPSSDELARAWFYANQVQRWLPTMPQGYAARCEVALAIHDDHLLQNCLADLMRVAPEHPETQRILAVVAERGAWRFWLAIALCAAAVLLTLGHALYRKRRPAPLRRGHAAVALALAITALTSVAATGPNAHAASDPQRLAPGDLGAERPKGPDLARTVVDDNNPEASVPGPEAAGANPLEYGYLIQDLLARAEAANKRGDHAAEVKYYRAIVKMVPDRSAGYTELCRAYRQSGDLDRAIDACALGLSADGVTVEDHAKLARLILGRPGPLTDKGRTLLTSSIEHLGKDEKTRAPSHHLQCELALRTGDLGLLKTCSAALERLAPTDPKTISFAWSLAVQEGKRSEALALITRAEKAGVQAEGIKNMRALTESKLGGPRRFVLPALLLLGAAAVLLLALALGRRAPARGV